MKRIIFFLANTELGGVQKFVVSLVTHLDKEKFDVIVVTGKNTKGRFSINNNIKVIKMKHDRMRFNLIEMSSIIKRFTPDYIFSSSLSNNLFVSISKYISFKKIRLIFREDILRNDYDNYFKKLFVTIFYSSVPYRVIVPSNALYDELVKIYKINDNKITVINNFIDLASLQNNYQVNKRPDSLIYVGRLDDGKKLDQLIEIVHALSNEFNLTLDLVGNGKIKSYLQHYCNELGLSEIVNFLGFQDEISTLVSSSMLLISLSESESFGNSILEALACGTLPVIKSSSRAPLEIIDYGKFGEIIQRDDNEAVIETLRNLLSNKDYIIKKSSRLFNRAKKYDVKKVILSFEEFFLS